MKEIRRWACLCGGKRNDQLYDENRQNCRNIRDRVIDRAIFNSRSGKDKRNEGNR